MVVTGLPAWLMHRGYHVLAVATWERKITSENTIQFVITCEFTDA